MRRPNLNNLTLTGIVLVGAVLLSRHTVPMPQRLDDFLSGLGVGLVLLGVAIACCDLTKLGKLKRKLFRLPTA